MEGGNQMFYQNCCASFSEFDKLEYEKKIQYLVNQVSQLNNENEDKNIIIAELNNKIHKLEKLTREMENVIRSRQYIIEQLSIRIDNLKDEISQMRSPEMQIQTTSIDSNNQSFTENRIGNPNFGKWLNIKKMEKNQNNENTETIKHLKATIGKLKKKIEDMEKKEKNGNKKVQKLNNIFRELFELSDVVINHRKYSSKLINFSFLLYRLSPSSYQLLRVYMPFPSHSKIYEHINLYLPPIINGLKANEICKIPHQTIYYASQSKKPVPINLGIDAICVVASSKYAHTHIENLYSFTIYLQPLGFDKKCLPVRLIESKSGIGNKEIVNILLQTSQELKRFNFESKFLSFDGDHCYNVLHQEYFKMYEEFLESGNIMGVIYKMKDILNLALADYLHMMKNQKSRFLKNVISLDKSGTKTFSISDLLHELGFDKTYLNDQTQLGAMRDGLALQLFDMNNIKQLFEKGKYTLVMGLLPLSLVNFSMRSTSLPINSRVHALLLCFWLCSMHLKIIKSRDKSLIGLTKNKNKKFVTFLSIIALKRLMNTLLSIIIALCSGYDSLCLDRLGTHCIELFFGLIRGFSKGVDGWDTFYRTIGKTIMAQESLNELNIKPVIKHRANLAGVVITDKFDMSLLQKISSDAFQTAKDLFNYLTTSNNIKNILNRFQRWLNSMAPYFPSPKKCTNPTSGVKIIARLVNASKKEKVDNDPDDENEEEEEEEELE